MALCITGSGIKSLEAKFFMKGEAVEYVEGLPRISPSQVHGAEIVHVSDENFGDYVLPDRPEADGVLLTTCRAGAELRFADCAPVMLWGVGWVMILHSGYKGTVLNIAGRGVELLREVCGDGVARGAKAWVGPCIGRENYCRDIGDEWTRRGLVEFSGDNVAGRDGKIFFDLAGEIRRQLIDAGVSAENIVLSGIDTFVDERCCSYRRGDKTERMTLYARLLH